MNRRIIPFVAVSMLVATATSAYTQEAEAPADPNAPLKYDPKNPGAFKTEQDARDFAAKKRAAQYAKAKADALAKSTNPKQTGDDLGKGGDPDFAPNGGANTGSKKNIAQANPGEKPATGGSTGGAAGVGGAGKSGDVPHVDLSSCKPESGKLSFNFDKAAINEVLDQISRIKCMNFILSDAVKGKNDITIVSRSPVTVSQAYAAFLSALEANGMALVPAGAFYKVVERKDSSKTPVPMYEVKDGVLTRMTPDDKRIGDLPNSDAQVTLLYEVKYAGKDQVQNLVRNLMTKNADLQTPAGNLFILTDSGSNILRILEVIDKIDVEGTSNKLNVVLLKWADASGVAGKLNDIFGVSQGPANAATKPGANAVRKPIAAAKPGEPPAPPAGNVPDGGDESGDITDTAIEKIIPDDRTNQLLVISSPKSFEKVLDVLKILDVPSDIGSTELKMWVVPLSNTDAQKAASTLSTLATGAAAKRPAAAG
ncbi:MAG TPA: secretin N-terminal domain-containing protein, partial [Myxococcota bacterium]